MHEGVARFLRLVGPEPLIDYAGINNSGTPSFAPL